MLTKQETIDDVGICAMYPCKVIVTANGDIGGMKEIKISSHGTVSECAIDETSIGCTIDAIKDGCRGRASIWTDKVTEV